MLGSVETAGYKLQTLIMVKKMAAVINVWAAKMFYID
jgi:hypothetical protein